MILRDVPPASEVLKSYRSLPVYGFCPITDEMRKVLDEADKPKKGRKKSGAKSCPSEPPQDPKTKKVKKAARRLRNPMPSDCEDSQSNTVSEILVQEDVQNEHDDTAATSHPEVS